MQNISLLYAIPALAATLLGFGLFAYWRLRRRLTARILAYSAFAYFLALAVKSAFQYFTYPGFLAAYGGSDLVLGLYFGMQTVILEVGLAYVFARLAVSSGKVGKSDVEGYGIGLAFWENGILLGLFAVLSLLVLYLELSAAGTLAVSIRSSLTAAQQQLFSAPTPIQAASNTFYSLAERTSSVLVHFSWGYLAMFAAIAKKKKYLLIALPMGFVDFLVPFAPAIGIPGFEALLLSLSILCLAAAIFSTSRERTAF